MCPQLIFDLIYIKLSFISALIVPFIIQRFNFCHFLLPSSYLFQAKGHYTIRLYREGVLRTCSVAYNVEDLENEFAHLSNHCIQVFGAWI
jgi:hypothetical protein